MMFCGFINVSVHIPLHGLNDCWRLHLCLTESLVMGNSQHFWHNISILTGFIMSWLTNPERKQYEFHCVHQAAEPILLSYVEVKLGRKVYAGSVIGLSKYKKWWEMTVWYNTTIISSVSNWHQGTALVIRKKANTVFVPTGSRLHQCLQCHVLTSSNHVAHNLINKHQHYDYSHHTISYKFVI